MVLLAAFQVLLAPLHRARRTSSSARRSPAATAAELEGLIGFFVNTLVLRGDLAGDPASASCWRGCGRRRWAPTPTRTCRSSGWWRSCSRSATCSRSPLFQVMFRSRTRRAGAAGAAGAGARARRSSTAETAKFDLDAHAGRDGGGAARRRSSTAPTSSTPPRSRGWRGTCGRLLERVRSRTPDRRSRRAAAADAGAERQQLLPELERAAVAELADEPACTSCFEAQAARAPGGRRRSRSRASTLTYGELDRPGQPAGPPPAAPRGAARGDRVGLCAGALAGDGRRRSSASSRPAAPTCRSIRPTRRSAWPSCWRTAAPRCC